MPVVTKTEKLNFLRSIFGQLYTGRDGKNVAALCPACRARGNSNSCGTKKKLIIQLDTDESHCWVCGWSSRSLLSLIRKFGSLEQFREYKERFVGTTTASADEFFTEQQKNVDLPVDFKLVVLASSRDPDANAVRRYLKSRNVDESDIWRYRLGVSNESKWARRVMIPSFMKSGALNYYIGRAIDRNVRPKYDNVDAKKTDIVFNDINIDWTKPLTVCEGPFDVFKAGENATCLLGSELNESHILFDSIVTHNTPIVLSLDDDMTDKTERIARKLIEYDVNVRIVDLNGHHDPGSMSKEEFKMLIDNAGEWSWNSSLKRRLNSLAV